MRKIILCALLFLAGPVQAQQQPVVPPPGTPMTAAESEKISNDITAWINSDELSTELNIGLQATQLFQKKDFEGLNKLSDGYRANEDKTPDGEPRINFFYKALDKYVTQQTPSMTFTPNEYAWKSMFGIVQQWIDTAPSPAAYVLMGRMKMNYAWDWRGNGAAPTVDKQAMQKFQENMKVAHDFMVANKAKADTDPEWYATMLLLQRGQIESDKEVHSLTIEAVTKFPHYLPIYGVLAENNAPEWFGSDLAVDAVARLAVSQTKDEWGSAFYPLVYLKILCMCGQPPQYHIDWPLMRQGFHDLIARYPANWNYNHYGAMACLMQDRDAAKEAILHITQVIAAAWDDSGNLYYSCRQWAVTEGDPVKPGGGDFEGGGSSSFGKAPANPPAH